MMYILLVGGLFLGWSFGRNSLSNVFGSAISTGMVPFKVAAALGGIFMALGALFSGDATTSNVLQLASLSTMTDAFVISISIAVVLWMFGRFALPMSIAQGTIGALVAWNCYHGFETDFTLIKKMAAAWVYSPIIAGFFGYFTFLIARKFLQTHPVHLLSRDMYVRVSLILVGIALAYALGANNLTTVMAPYIGTSSLGTRELMFMAGVAVVLGVWMADKGVIQTLSTGLFPLSPTEAFTSTLASAMTLSLFSGKTLREWLIAVHLPHFPLVPVSTSLVIIGSIVGLSIAKGGYGLRWKTVGKIILSFLLAPVFSGLLCYAFLSMFALWGAKI